jgi:hypothetical protein
MLTVEARSASDVTVNGAALPNCQDNALALCTHDVLCGDKVKYYLDLGGNGYVSVRIVHGSCETDYSQHP